MFKASNSSIRHAADTPPLEGLLILRCATHDPLERFQIWKMKVVKMRVQELNLGVWCLKLPARCVPQWTCCTCSLVVNMGVGCGGCDNVLHQYNTWHSGTDASRSKEKWMDDVVDACSRNLKIINSYCFFNKHSKSAGEMQKFALE